MVIDLTAMGQKAKQAATQVAQLSTGTKNEALMTMARLLRENQAEMLKANATDLENATAMPAKFVDRLKLTDQRIEDMAQGLEHVAQLNDPTAQYDRGWVTPDGLQIMQRRVPLGVIGIIFEARPNVSVDATALTFKSGNAVILRGGKEAI